MVSGAAAADAAVLVVDAAEGVREQTRRHGYLLHLLGVRQVAVAVSKMDLVDYDEARFAEVSREISHYLGEIGVVPTFIVPISGRDGDNIAVNKAAVGRDTGQDTGQDTGKNDVSMAWYDGPSLLEALERFQSVTQPVDQPLRFPVQDVYKFDQRRIIAGRIESGILRAGDRLLFSPSNRTARVRAIEVWNSDAECLEARAGQSVAITLDEQVFVERGEMASHEELPPMLSTVFRATLFWLAQEPLEADRTYKLKLGTREARVRVQSIERVIDTDTLAGNPADRVERNDVGEVVLRCREILALDEYRDLARTGRFALVDDYDTVAGGVISMEGYPDQRHAFGVKSENLTSVEHRVTAPHRTERNGHCGGVLWFTGLSGSGKSTLAMAVEQRLFNKGYHVYVLDGDNVRGGLNANLGFSPEDRAENIRRVGEVAGLFADSGVICISAFISPYRADRERARAASKGGFHEIFIKAGLEACERRDPKGLYRKARAGEIADFTGISAPYEPPSQAELVVDTEVADIEDSVRQVVDYVERNFARHCNPGKA
jgi:bifunctional enzyme CysN/CysC